MLEHKYIVFKNKETQELSYAVFYSSRSHDEIAILVKYMNPSLEVRSAGFLSFNKLVDGSDLNPPLYTHGRSITLKTFPHPEDGNYLLKHVDVESWLKDPFRDPEYSDDIKMLN